MISINQTSLGNYREDVRTVRDCLAGNRAIKNNGELYLPKFEGQSPTSYNAMRNRALFFGIPKITLEATFGRVFRKPTVWAMPDKLKERPATIDGQSWDWVAETVFKEVLSVGRSLLVLAPHMDADLQQSTRVLVYRSEDIEDVKYDGTRIVSLLVNDVSCEADERIEFCLENGQYVSRRVLVTNSERVPIADKGGVQTVWGKTLNYVPAWIVTPEDFSSCETTAPLAGLCEISIAIYQLYSEYRQALHFTGSPQPVTYGFKKEELPSHIGPDTIWHAADPNAKAELLTFSGQGLAEMRAALDFLRQQAAVAGASMLLPKTQGAQAARTVELNQRSEASLAMQCVLSVNHALTDLLSAATAWERVDAAGVTPACRVNTDLVDGGMDAATLTALMKACQSGLISHATFHENLQKGEIVPPSRSVEERRRAARSSGSPSGLARNPRTPVDRALRETCATPYIDVLYKRLRRFGVTVRWPHFPALVKPRMQMSVEIQPEVAL